MTTYAKPTLGPDLTFYRTEEANRHHIKVTSREKSRSGQMWRLRPNASPAMRRSEERSSCRSYQSMLGSVAWDVCAAADDVKWRCVRKCRFRAQWEPFLKCAILNSPLLRRFSVPRRLLLRSGRHSMELSVTVLMIQGV